jgi:hypothetical protein
LPRQTVDSDQMGLLPDQSVSPENPEPHPDSTH